MRVYEHERVRRGNQLLKWILGHAVEALDSPPNMVRLRAGDIEFTEPRSSFPSEYLIANLALAIDASGQFSRDAFDIGDFDHDMVEDALFRTGGPLYRANLEAWADGKAKTFMFMGERMP